MTDYYELARLADSILTIGEENIDKLVAALDTLEQDLRDELLNSDFLNAYQVYYFHFREPPSELAEERLILQPATALQKGILMDECGLLELNFIVKGTRPEIQVSDGESVLAVFTSKTAYHDAVDFAEKYD